MTLFIIALLCMLLYIVLDLKKAFHMLQQNWYNDGNRYLNWISLNGKFVFMYYDYFYVLVLLGYFVNNNLLSILVIVYYLLISYLLYKRYKKEQVKKPLAFTSRIKRMCVTIFILYLIPISFIFLSFNSNLIYLYYFIIGSLIYFNYYIVYLANIINKPVEKLVYLCSR